MKGYMIRKIAVMGLVVAGMLSPVAAEAADFSSWGMFYFNDGSGTCGYVSCGENGCITIDTFPCPREVSGE